jgi:hypothetical protein
MEQKTEAAPFHLSHNETRDISAAAVSSQQGFSYLRPSTLKNAAVERAHLRLLNAH